MKNAAKPRPVIISLGGNSIIRRGEAGTIEEQFANLSRSMSYAAAVITGGRPVVITHGNGPIVGNIVIRNEALRQTIPPMPLYLCDADSEGAIGFMIQQTLHNELVTAHKIEEVVTVVTQVVVNADDPAFANPTKPIGPYYTKQQAEELTRSRGYVVTPVGRGGFRRVVPSPRPIKIIEALVIKKLVGLGVVVIAVGGGGVPVVETADGTLAGVDAVIDKDYATSVLAREINAETVINLTEVDCVYLDYESPAQRELRTMSLDEARGFLEDGQFPAGSMGPKIEAAIEFLEGGGKEVIITAPELIDEAMAGKAGTRITV